MQLVDSVLIKSVGHLISYFVFESPQNTVGVVYAVMYKNSKMNLKMPVMLWDTKVHRPILELTF